MLGRQCLDKKKTETRGEESHTCSDDLFNFHKRHINLLGKLPNSFIGVLISEGINVDLHPWGALLDEISRLTSQTGYSSLLLPMSPAPRVFLGGALLLIRLRLTSSVQSLLPGSPYLSFPWTTLVLCPLLLLHIFSLSMLWMKGGTDYLQVTDRDQFLRQARTEGKEADWCQPNALAEKRWWNGRVDINIYQLDNFPEWRPPLRL